MQIWDRLHADYARKVRLNRQLIELRDKQTLHELDELTHVGMDYFRNSRPPDEAIQKLAFQRRRHRMESYLEYAQPKFQPSILTHSETIAQKSGRVDRPVFQRLYPGPNTGPLEESKTIRPQSSSSSVSAFLERQEAYAKVRDLKRRIREKIEYQDCSFQPQLTARSMVLGARVADDQSACGRTARSSAREPPDWYSLNEECTFAPRIDPLSDALASQLLPRIISGTVFERLHEGPPPTARQLTESQEDPIHDTRSIHASKLYSAIPSKYSLRDPAKTMNAIIRSRNDKEEWIGRCRKERSEREGQECTFQPDVSKRLSQGRSRPVPIAGLSAFMSQRARGRRLDSLSRIPKLREYRPSSAGSHLTTPHPFNLSGTN